VGSFILFKIFTTPEIIVIEVPYFKEIPLKEFNEEIPFDSEKLNWTLNNENAPWAKRDAHTVEVFDGNILLMGGIEDGDINIAYEYHTHFSDVWSNDGKDWKLITNVAEFGRRRAHSSVVFDGKIWIFGGWEKNDWEMKNDIWYSTNGKDWELAVESAPWTKYI